MKKHLYLLLSILSYSCLSFSQNDTIPSLKHYREYNEPKITTNLFASYTIGGKDKKTNHTIELGVIRNKDYTVVEPVSLGYYASNEFVVSSRGFNIGPKVGGYFAMWLFCIGLDVIHYTDFKDNTTHIAPYFGFGGSHIRLFISPHLPLYNKDFKNTNYFSVGLTISFATISKKGLKFGF